MILQELKQKLEGRGWVEQSSLARHFNLSVDALDSMLSIWLRRGHIEKQNLQACKGGCGCDASDNVRYRWVGGNRIALSQ